MKNEYHHTLSSNVGHAFGIEASHVQKICLKTEIEPKPPCRPPALAKIKPPGCLLSFEVDMALTIM
jgi:hypothetical protein